MKSIFSSWLSLSKSNVGAVATVDAASAALAAARSAPKPAFDAADPALSDAEPAAVASAEPAPAAAEPTSDVLGAGSVEPDWTTLAVVGASLGFDEHATMATNSAQRANFCMARRLPLAGLARVLFVTQVKGNFVP